MEEEEKEKEKENENENENSFSMSTYGVRNESRQQALMTGQAVLRVVIVLDCRAVSEARESLKRCSHRRRSGRDAARRSL